MSDHFWDLLHLVLLVTLELTILYYGSTMVALLKQLR